MPNQIQSRPSHLRLAFALTALLLGSLAIVIVAERSGLWGASKLGQVLRWSKDQVDDRVLLVLTWPSEIAEKNQTFARLMNRDGSVFHEWKFERAIMHARLLANGNLYVMFFADSDKRVSAARGECDEIAEFDWNGKKLWSYPKALLHHDLISVDGDSVAALQSEALSAADKTRYVPDAVGTAFGDSVIVVKKSTGEVTWRWSLSTVLPDFKDRILDTRDPDVGHFNSLQYIAKNPWNGQPAFLVGSRELSTVFAIDVATKKILWSSPRGVFFVQHDAQLLDNGHILGFDNGVRATHVATRILVLDPKTNQITWSWSDPYNFFAVPMMGGVQKQPNGNFLVTNSHIGQVFEITPGGKIVWNFLMAFEPNLLADERIWWPGSRLYRVISYPRPQR